ncbi:MAG: VOC family protein [Sphingorhabdus sp.]
MPIRQALIAALVATTGIAIPAAAQTQTLEVKRFGLYMLATDIDRSVAFYEALFMKAPQVRTPALVGFDIAGGLFGIVDLNSFAPGMQAGGGVRPYIRVADIDAAFAHVNNVAPGRIENGRVTTEGAFSFFRFTDPDGNTLEFFSVTEVR